MHIPSCIGKIIISFWIKNSYSWILWLILGIYGPSESIQTNRIVYKIRLDYKQILTEIQIQNATPIYTIIVKETTVKYSEIGIN